MGLTSKEAENFVLLLRAEIIDNSDQFAELMKGRHEHNLVGLHQRAVADRKNKHKWCFKHWLS